MLERSSVFFSATLDLNASVHWRQPGFRPTSYVHCRMGCSFLGRRRAGSGPPLAAPYNALSLSGRAGRHIDLGVYMALSAPLEGKVVLLVQAKPGGGGGGQLRTFTSPVC